VRRLLARTSLVSALVSALVAVVLAIGVLWWAVSTHTAEVTAWLTTDPSTGVARFATVMLAAGALGVAAGHLATAGVRAHVERASQDLVAMAKRLAAGEARLVPVRSDISEIDTVSEVMTRRAHDMTKSLAAERDFASDASHQLRTPLTALLMRLEEISLTDDPEVVKE
jgi:signal transduction histidine kinase